MLQIIECENCRKSSIPLDAISVNVNFNKSSWCDSCNQSKSETQSYFFCTKDCFLKFIDKVVGGQKEFKWKEIKVVNGIVSYE